MPDKNDKPSILWDPNKAVEWLWDTIETFFLAMFKSVWNGFTEMWDILIVNTWNFVVDKIFATEPERWRRMLAPYVQMGVITQEQANDIYKLKDLMFPLDLIMYIAVTLKMLFTFIMVKSDSSVSFLSQATNKELRPHLPNYNDIIRAAFVAPERTGEVREILKKYGVTDEDIELIFLSNYRLYAEETVRVLWLRKVIDDNEMFMRMRELGYTDTRTKEIIQSWSLLPSPNDLFFMVAHEAFEPEIYETMGLDDEFPTEQIEWLQKQGISEEWARKYWIAHWEQPSIQQGFEMLHRGVIGWEDLNRLFKAVEIPPYWRDKLNAIAYRPYTRVDTRRMHDMGVLDDNELIQAYKDQGYDDERAMNMALFTVRYNQQNDRELTKSEILSGYREKAIDRRDAFDLLVDIEYSEDMADYLLTFEDYKETKDIQDDQIKNVKERFQMNLINRPEAERHLNSMNLPAAQISVLMEKWEIARFKDRKVPSKDDLKKFLRNGIIDEDIFRREMDRLGYNFKYTEYYEKLYKIDKPK